jgi:hypothetical protein
MTIAGERSAEPSWESKLQSTSTNGALAVGSIRPAVAGTAVQSRDKRQLAGESKAVLDEVHRSKSKIEKPTANPLKSTM